MDYLKNSLLKITNNIRSKIRKWLHSARLYIIDDYGVDVVKVWNSFINGKFIYVAKRVLLVLCSIGIVIVWPIAFCMLALAYPLFFLVWTCLTIIGLLYCLLRDKLDEKYRII